jgi:hypothetical protein
MLGPTETKDLFRLRHLVHSDLTNQEDLRELLTGPWFEAKSRSQKVGYPGLETLTLTLSRSRGSQALPTGHTDFFNGIILTHQNSFSDFGILQNLLLNGHINDFVSRTRKSFSILQEV